MLRAYSLPGRWEDKDTSERPQTRVACDSQLHRVKLQVGQYETG